MSEMPRFPLGGPLSIPVSGLGSARSFAIDLPSLDQGSQDVASVRREYECSLDIRDRLLSGVSQPDDSDVGLLSRFEGADRIVEPGIARIRND